MPRRPKLFMHSGYRRACVARRRIVSEPGSPPAPRDSGHQGEDAALDRSLVQGVAWTGGMKWLTQLFSWAVTLIVARVLTPEDYGLMGMALVFLGFVELVNEFGIGAAVVQREEITARQVDQLGGFSIVVGLLLFGACAAASPLVAAFFHEPPVRWIVVVLSFNFVISSFRVIPRSLLTRELRFRELAWIDGAGAVVTSLLTLVLALAGFRYWSLVAGGVASAVVSTVLVLRLRPVWPGWPGQLETIASEIRFGWNVVVSRVAWYAYSNADFAVVGRILGTVALGAYNIGWTLASVPVEKISVLIGRVTPAVFARVQDEPERLRRYLRLVTQGISLLTFPAAVGLALVTDDFVLVVLGDKWRPAIVPLRLLALYGGFRSVTTLFAQILTATDRTRENMWYSVIMALLLPALFVAGTRWGTVGVAAVWLTAYPLLIALLPMRATLRLIGMSLGEYLGALWPAASACLLMAAAVVAVRLALPQEVARQARLAATVGAGAVVYAGIVFSLYRERVTRAWSYLRGTGDPDGSRPTEAA